MAVASGIKDISTEAFNTIGKMDKACRKLAKLLDRKTKELAANKNATIEEINETELMRKALDTLSVGKVQLAVKNYDLIDHNIKIVDNEIALLENALIANGELNYGDDVGGGMSAATVGGSGLNKKRKHEKASASGAPIEPVIDPNEPVYCFCKRIAFGDMIACDNEDCDVEWFHYPCVNLTRKPRNSWICPTCAYKRKK